MIMSSVLPVEIIPGHAEQHSGIRRKSVRLPPGILFAFIPESCSESARNAVRLHPGTLFDFARNPQASIGRHRMSELTGFAIGISRFD
jgi:hypothetical protein